MEACTLVCNHWTGLLGLPIPLLVRAEAKLAYYLYLSLCQVVGIGQRSRAYLISSNK